MGVFSLLAAVMLLIQVAALKRVASGAAFADHMAYVTGGILCLAASVLIRWLPEAIGLGIDAGQAHVFADALIGVSMVLLGVYFFRVHRAMMRYLRYLGGEAALAKAHADDADRSEEPRA